MWIWRDTNWLGRMWVVVGHRLRRRTRRLFKQRCGGLGFHGDKGKKEEEEEQLYPSSQQATAAIYGKGGDSKTGSAIG
jgi:hypothetical protein